MTLFPGAIYGGVAQLGASAKAAATPWYLTGGIAAANCVAAYQPKGAADYAASKVNLANPGTYNAADGTAFPTWDSTNGWIFNGTNTTGPYLLTGVINANGWSMILRFSNGPTLSYSCQPVGSLTTYSTRFSFSTYYADNKLYYHSGGIAGISTGITSGVIAIAGQSGYRNGTADTNSIPAWSGTNTNQIAIGGMMNAGLVTNKITANIQALAIYNTTLTAPQVAALSAAMAAL